MLTREELLAAAQAAERWPVGANPGMFLSDNELDRKFRWNERLPLEGGMGCGCPAFEVAVLRAQARGMRNVTMKMASRALGDVVEFYYSEKAAEVVSEDDMMLELLADNPKHLAAQFRQLADQIPAENTTSVTVER